MFTLADTSVVCLYSLLSAFIAGYFIIYLFYPLQSVTHSQLCDVQWSKRVFDTHGAKTIQLRPLKNTTQNMEHPSQSAKPRPDELIDTQAGLKYWQDISNDVDGMLGGIPA